MLVTLEPRGSRNRACSYTFIHGASVSFITSGENTSYDYLQLTVNASVLDHLAIVALCIRVSRDEDAHAPSPDPHFVDKHLSGSFH